MPASTSHRIGIVGAGTAGLATAIAFARAGHAVDVFEKHASLATLGAGVLIQPQGVAALDDLGVGPAFESISMPIDRLLGQCERGWTLVDIGYRDLQARAVSRSALGGVLERACLSLGVRLHFGCGVDAIASDGAHGILEIGGAQHRFDLAVIANGAASLLPAASGMAVKSRLYDWGALWSLVDLDDWPEPRILAQRYGGTERMAGIMPTEQVGGKLRVSLFWSLRRDRYDAWRAAPLDDWKQQLLTLWPGSRPVLDQLHAHEQLAFASYRHARPTRLAAGPVCIVGDAAHAMSPQLGLGTTLAVQDALVLAACVDKHGALEGAARYAGSRLRTVRTYQALSRALTPCFQFDGGGLWRDLLFGGLLRMPGSRYLMHRSIAAPQGRLRQAWAAGATDAAG